MATPALATATAKMAEPGQLNDAYKADVLKFLNSQPGVALVEALRARAPLWPGGNESAHEYHRISGKIEGFAKCLEELKKIPQELQQEPPNEHENKLLDPRD